MKYILAVAALLFSVIMPAQAVDTHTVRLATSSSLVASGLIDILKPAFKTATGYDLEVYAVGSGRALRMGRLGQADVVIAHAPNIEQRFVVAGHAELRLPLMKNTFILVGPEDDPAGAKGSATTAEAFRKIASQQKTFVTRADDSGNHKKELEAWTAANITPGGDWYYQTGQGMLPSLRKASELAAYLIVDSGSWLNNRRQTKLAPIVTTDPLLENPYSLIATSEAKHPEINHEGKTAFVEWILSSEGLGLISSLKVDGESLFTVTR